MKETICCETSQLDYTVCDWHFKVSTVRRSDSLRQFTVSNECYHKQTTVNTRLTLYVFWAWRARTYHEWFYFFICNIWLLLWFTKIKIKSNPSLHHHQVIHFEFLRCAYLVLHLIFHNIMSISKAITYLQKSSKVEVSDWCQALFSVTKSAVPSAPKECWCSFNIYDAKGLAVGLGGIHYHTL